MTITVKTTIGFKLPEEYEQYKTFIETNNLSDWSEHGFSSGTFYAKT